MSGTHRTLPAEARACIQCAYLETTQRGQGNRSSYTSYCTKYGTNAHEERTSLGTCGPAGVAWEPIGATTGPTYTRDAEAPPPSTGTLAT